MRISMLIAAAILLTAADGPSMGANEDPEGSAKKIAELNKERITTLTNAAEVSTKLAQIARVEASEAMEDQMALLKAEAEAAETESERLVLYTDAVKSLKELEELAQAQKQAARATELPRLRIKAKRLEIEILLERAKSKERK